MYFCCSILFLYLYEQLHHLLKFQTMIQLLQQEALVYKIYTSLPLSLSMSGHFGKSQKPPYLQQRNSISTSHCHLQRTHTRLMFKIIKLEQTYWGQNLELKFSSSKYQSKYQNINYLNIKILMMYDIYFVDVFKIVSCVKMFSTSV